MLLVRSLGPSHLREDTLPWPQETQAACLPLPGGGPRRLPPSSTEGRSPSPTDYPCQAQCQLTRSQSGPERQVPGLSVGCLEAPVPSSSAVGLRSAGRSVPNTREGSGQKQDRAECKKKPESAQREAPEQTCPPRPRPSCPMSAGTGQAVVPASLTRQMLLPGEGHAVRKPPAGGCTPHH